MHPIEHLRYLARVGDAPASWLVPEAAEALRGLLGDRNALVLGSRKLLEHHPACGPLWWLCGRILVARDPALGIEDLIETFVEDPTPLESSLALAGADGSPRILEVAMATGTRVAIDQPVPGDEPVWVAAGVGTLVPEAVFQFALERTGFEVVSATAIERVVRPSGAGGVALLRGAPDVPLVPELFTRDP